MKTMVISDLKADENQIREIMDNFFHANEGGVVRNIQSTRVSDTAFDLKVHYQGDMVLPFDKE